MIFKKPVPKTGIKYRLVGILSCLFLITGPAYAQNPVVVELFTSKYCPACPPADRAFHRMLEHNPDIIGLSCHVTYFDGERRKNALSAKFCNERQNIYKLALRTGALFTPMAIIQGQTLTKAKTVKDLKTAIQGTTFAPNQAARISLRGQYVDIHLPAATLQNPADLWLFEYIKAPQQGGYTQYRNAVTKITKLMRWNGQKMNMVFPVNPGFGNNKGFAVIAQDFKTGILTAAKTP